MSMVTEAWRVPRPKADGGRTDRFAMDRRKTGSLIEWLAG